MVSVAKIVVLGENSTTTVQDDEAGSEAPQVPPVPGYPAPPRNSKGAANPLPDIPVEDTPPLFVIVNVLVGLLPMVIVP